MKRSLVRRAAVHVREALVRRGRRPGLRTLKTTLAAVIAYVIAQRFGSEPQPLLAPLTALLVVQLTMYETLTSSVERVAGVSAGVLVAVAVASYVGLTWWSLGAVIAVSILIGRLLRLGSQLLEVPISAMLVLAVGGAEDFAAARTRIGDTLVGAAVGVLVNAAIAPPLHLQPADDAIAELASRMAAMVREMAAALRQGWSREAALHWLHRARALGSEVAHADRTLARAEESARFNPRRAAAREAVPRLRVGLTGLEHAQVTLRSLCRSLLDRTFFVPPEEESTVYDASVRAAIADVLDASADAIERVIPVTSASEPRDSAQGTVVEALERLTRRRDRLLELVALTPQSDRGAWQQHGALLAAIDRLRVEIEAAVQTPEGEWRPPQVIEPRRQAVQQHIGARVQGMRERTRRRRGPD